MTAERKRILVAVDFEGAAKRALATARSLAGPLEADLVLLHVHNSCGFDHPELPSDTVEHVRGVVERSAVKLLADLAAESGAKETIFRHGDVAEQIIEVARQTQPAMLVMGTHGRHGLSRVFLGSVAAEVVRACPTPVLTVRAAAEEAT